MKNKNIFNFFIFMFLLILPITLVGCFSFDFSDDDVFENTETLHEDGEDLRSNLLAVDENGTYAFEVIAGEGKQYNNFLFVKHNSDDTLESNMIGCLVDSDEEEDENTDYVVAVYDADKEEVEVSGFDSSTGIFYRNSEVFTVNEGETFYIVITIVNTTSEYSVFDLIVSYSAL